MAEVEIYTTPMCGYCSRAKRLLKAKGVKFQEIDVMLSKTRRNEMMARAGSHTVPQIFVNGELVGGSDELMMLEVDGKLDGLLGLE